MGKALKKTKTDFEITRFGRFLAECLDSQDLRKVQGAQIHTISLCTQFSPV